MTSLFVEAERRHRTIIEYRDLWTLKAHLDEPCSSPGYANGGHVVA